MVRRMRAVCGLCLLCLAGASGAAIQYSYDSLNRLTGVTYPDGTTIGYAYDSAGNRLSQVISNPSIPLPKVGVDKNTLTFSTSAGQTAATQIVVVTNGGGGNLQWNAVSTAAWLSVTPGSGTNSGAVNVAASAAGMSAGTYNASVTILASASNAPVTIPVIFTVTPALGNPSISSGGLVSAAGSNPGIARGSIASLYGTALADASATATAVPLPRTLGNVQVSVNGVSAPLWYVDPQQVNFQVPFEAPLQGQASVVVTRDGVASSPMTVALTPYAPSIFTYQRVAGVFDPVIVHATDNQLVTPSDPAVAGEYVVVYGTGIGDLTVALATDTLSPTNPPAAAKVTPTAMIGGVNAPVSFAGLTPGLIGLAQFNVQVPNNLPSGSALPLVINFNGAASAPVNLAVKNAVQTPVISTVAAGGGLALDPSGNIYTTHNGNTVWKTAPDGTTALIAGNGTAGGGGDGGLAVNAQLNSPIAVAVDGANNLYIADYANGRVRVVTPDGRIAAFAGNGQYGSGGDGGPASQAQFAELRNLTTDQAGDVFIVSALTVRKVGVDGIIRAVAGDPSCWGGGYRGDGGPAVNACLYVASQVAVGSNGFLYIADALNYRVRRVDPATGVITTFAGNGSSGFSGDGGPATQAQLKAPSGVAVDRAGSVYISDQGNSRVRKVALDGTITTVVGTGVAGFSGDGGAPGAAQLNEPANLAFDQAGNLYISDYGRIRKVVLPQ